MGGGVGVAAHGNVRVVTETTKIAMPEVGIGFIPDVGGTYLLSRAPGLLGLHAALTGRPFTGADAIALGFADHYVPHDGARARSPPPSSATAWRPPSAPTPWSRRRVSFWHSRTGSTSATRATPSTDIVAALARPRRRRRPADAAEPASRPARPRGVAWRCEPFAGRPSSTHWKTFCARSIGYPARRCAVHDSGGGYPRPDHRQGPQSQVVTRHRWPRSPPPMSRPTSHPAEPELTVRGGQVNYETILVDRDDRVGTITLNRPQGAQCAQQPGDERSHRGRSRIRRRPRHRGHHRHRQ